MKLKTIVLISLMAFGLTFGVVMIVGLVFMKGSSGPLLGGTSATDGQGTVAQVLTTGTPVVTPSGNASAQSTGSATPVASTPAAAASTGAPAKSSAITPAASSAQPVAASSAPPAPACGSAGGTCSAAQVASHSSAGNCWVIYNSGYYNVTSYVNAHPGGSAVFNSSTCGKNITSYLNGSAATAGAQHRHSQSAYSVLNSYYIGKVQ